MNKISLYHTKLTILLCISTTISLHAQPSNSEAPRNRRAGGIEKDGIGLFFGINKYNKESGFGALRYAVNDAIALAYAFSIENNRIEAKNIQLVLNGSPTNPELRRKLNLLLLDGARVDSTDLTKNRMEGIVNDFITNAKNRTDLVVLSISSHGVDSGKNVYAVPPDYFEGLNYDMGALNMSLVSTRLQENRLAKTNRQEGGKQLVLFDACRVLTEGVGKSGKSTSLTNIMQSLNAKTSGFAFFPSASEGQISYELPEYEHGAFTYAFLEALRGQAGSDTDAYGFIRLSAVENYVRNVVPMLVNERSRGECGGPNATPCLQTPPSFEGNDAARQIIVGIDFNRYWIQTSDLLRKRIEFAKGVNVFNQAAFDLVAAKFEKAQHEGNKPWEFLEIVRSFAEDITPRPAFMAYLQLYDKEAEIERLKADVEIAKKTLEPKVIALEVEVRQLKEQVQILKQPRPLATILKIASPAHLGQRVVPQLVTQYLKTIGADKIRWAKDTLGVMRIISVLPDDSTRKVIEVWPMNVVERASCLASKHCEMILGTQDLVSHDSTIAVTLRKHNVSRTLLFKEGLVLIVNKANKWLGQGEGIVSLSLSQLGNIFSGEQKRWKEVFPNSSHDGEIKIYATQDVVHNPIFVDYVLSGRYLSAQIILLPDERQVAQAVNADSTGLALVSTTEIGDNNSIQIFKGGISPVSPNYITLTSGTYPLAYDTFLYKQGNNQYASGLMDFALANAGQKVFREFGHVHLNPTFVPFDVTKYVEEEKWFAGADKLSTVFSFKDGNLSEDAEIQFKKLLEFLLLPENAGRPIIIAGHTARTDTRAGRLVKNESDQYAQQVVERLKNAGIHVAKEFVFALSEKIPTQSPISNSWNRRVEVFLVRPNFKP